MFRVEWQLLDSLCSAAILTGPFDTPQLAYAHTKVKLGQPTLSCEVALAQANHCCKQAHAKAGLQQQPRVQTQPMLLFTLPVLHMLPLLVHQ